MSAPARKGALAGALVALALILPATATAATQTLTVEKAGTSTGTVTSSPAGISCGATCAFAFTEATLITLTGTPAANTAPVQWSGCETVTVEKKCKVTMSAAKTVKATFDVAKRKLTLTKAGSGAAASSVTSSPKGIECGPTCSAEYDHGTAVVLTGSPGPNVEAVKWSGCSAVNGENKCEVTMSAAKAVTATFAIEKHLLTVTKIGSGAATSSVTSSPAGIACGATCAAKYDHGSVITLSGAPGAGMEPAGWSGCDSVSAEDKCIVAIQAAREVKANFHPAQLALTVTKSGPAAGFGTVTSSPAGIECGPSCSAGFDQGSTATLSGTPGTHVKAVQWSGCSSITIENTCKVTMSTAKAITASFEFQPGYALYTVAVDKRGTGQGTIAASVGSIDCGPICEDQLIKGTVLTLTASPAQGSAFDHWSGGNCTGAGPCTTTIVSSRTVHALFTAIGTRTLTVTKTGTGTGTIASKPLGTDCGGGCTVSAATKLTLTASPAEDSSFTGWSGACSDASPSCKLAMNEARSVSARFEAIPISETGGRVVVAASAKVKGKRAALKILCNGPSGCKGTLRLLAKVKAKTLTLGAATFKLAPGAQTLLHVPLSAKAAQLLAPTGHLRVKVTGSGIHAHSVNLKTQARK